MTVRFLLIRFDHSEEVRLAAGLAGRLKEAVEEAEIHFLSQEGNAGVLHEESDIDHLHLVENGKDPDTIALKKLGFDYIVDLQNDGRTRLLKFRLKRYDFSLKKHSLRERFLGFFSGKLPELPPLEERYLDTIRIFLDE